MYRNLLAEMRRQGITQLDLANAIGVSRQTLSKWISGRTGITLIHCKKIQSVIGGSLDFLFATGKEKSNDRENL